jgi:hypothetical protein
MELLDHPPPPWTNQELVLFHGTTLNAASSIVDSGVDLTRSRPGGDFGRGFYTTTLERQARQWARKKQRQRSILRPEEQAAVVELSIWRNEFAVLEFLAFVDGSDQALDYWSFVHWCRRGGLTHNRQPDHAFRAGFYDCVIGPVAGDWEQNLTIPGDQISFHTQIAEDFLNNSCRRRMIVL